MRRTVEGLIDEFRREIHSSLARLQQEVDGQLFVHSRTLPPGTNVDHSPIIWILRAQQGTLEKLGLMFKREGIYESFELLAIARNLFENLVWLRLMNLDHRYGLVFFAILLQNQKAHNENMRKQALAEAVLFDSMDALDDDVLESTLLSNLDPTEDELKELQAAFIARRDELDDMVRREYCLHASAATENGYALQAMLIRDKLLPELDKRDATLAQNDSLLAPVLATTLTANLQGCIKKWNWQLQAKLVGMEKNYDFLYRFTSRLLHSTPINLITDKALAPEEQLVILDYIVISAGDVLKEIESLQYAGKTKLRMIRVTE
jgi:AcrR family transcriptional regulator